MNKFQDLVPAFGIFGLLAFALYFITDKPLEMQCEGRGWVLITDTDELAKGMVFGTIDGKEVAVSRDSILKCRRDP